MCVYVCTLGGTSLWMLVADCLQAKQKAVWLSYCNSCTLMTDNFDDLFIPELLMCCFCVAELKLRRPVCDFSI